MRFTSVDDLLAAGEVDLGVSSWFPITQDRVNGFADATDDHQWIHTDVARATAEGPFGGPVAHGYLTLALAAPILFEIFQVEGVSAAINYGLNKVRFSAPVPVGAELRAAGRLLAARKKAGIVECTIKLTYELASGGKSPCTAELVILVTP